MITIIKNTDAEFYSAYNPIIIQAYDASSDTAYLKGELFVETPMGSGNYASTDIIINGYETENQTIVYEFNIMEYTRPFISKGLCPIISNTAFYLPGFFETRKFKLAIWAVKYSPGQYGQLYDDRNNIVETKDFTAVATITHDEYSMDRVDDFTNMNRLVLGHNDTSAPIQNSHQYLTNAPNKNYHSCYKINSTDEPSDSLYIPVVYDDTRAHLTLTYLIRNKSTQTWVLKAFQLPGGTNQVHRIPLNPFVIEMFYMLHHGTAMNTMIDSSGNLIADKFAVAVALTSNSFGNTLYVTDKDDSSNVWRFYDLTDKKDNGKCNRTKFVFKNSKGGYDWFNAYGTETKSVKISGDSYEKHVSLSLRGLHSKKNVWTGREDSFSVFSQPLTKEESVWLEELVSSPQVWVQKTVLNAEKEEDKYLKPIIIDTGSYTSYNTDDNVHFVEFKYKYSNDIKTQRG